MAPRISVAMATCNGLPFIDAQLRSIAGQVVPVAELVVCDDASTDGSWECLTEFARAHPEVHCFRNDVRLGASQNFARAISRCSGDIIFLSDQDDVWHPEKVSLLTAELERRDAVLAMSNGDLMAADGTPLGSSLWQDNGITDEVVLQLESKEACDALLRRVYFTGSALCFRASAVASILPIPGGVWHDRWIAFVAALAWPGRFALLDRNLYGYRQHARNQIGARRGRAFVHRAWKEIHTPENIENEAHFFLAAIERIAVLRGRTMVDEATAGRLTEASESGLRHVRRRCEYIEGSLPWTDIVRAARVRDYRTFSRGSSTMVRDVLTRLLMPHRV